MVRMSILSAAFLVLAGTIVTAEEPKKEDEKGFRVYSIRPRCGQRVLQGVFASPAEAFQAATKCRALPIPSNVEVTTGSEGKQVPTGQPALYQVYTKTCDKSGWQERGLFVDVKKLEAAVKTLGTNGDKVEVVRDYKPQEVFHVYGKGCRTPVSQKQRLLGTYRTIREAAEAVEGFRTNTSLRCAVTVGTKGQELLDGSPTQYKVYVQGCKGSWSLETTTNDLEKLQQAVEAQMKEKARVEVVHLYGTAK